MRLCLGKVLLEVVRRNEFDPSDQNPTAARDSIDIDRGELSPTMPGYDLSLRDAATSMKPVLFAVSAHSDTAYPGFQAGEFILAGLVLRYMSRLPGVKA